MEDANEPRQPAAPGDVKQEGGDAPIGPTAHTGSGGPQPVEPPDMHIRVDRQDFDVSPAELHDGELTGKEIRELATPPIGPDRDIFEIVPGGSDRKIEDGDTVAIRDHIRFFSAPRNINPGMALSPVRRSSRSPCGRSLRHAAQ